MHMGRTSIIITHGTIEGCSSCEVSESKDQDLRVVFQMMCAPWIKVIESSAEVEIKFTINSARWQNYQIAH